MKSVVMQIHKQKPAQNTLHGEEYIDIFSPFFCVRVIYDASVFLQPIKKANSKFSRMKKKTAIIFFFFCQFPAPPISSPPTRIP